MPAKNKDSAIEKDIKKYGSIVARYGILTTLRAKGRMVLFTLLILILTLTLTFGVGMWAYSMQMLSKMDSQYTSIAILEYMGEDYPNEDAADTGARSAFASLDDKAIESVDGVKLWTRKNAAIGYLEGYTNISGGTMFEYYGVVIASYIKDEGNDGGYGRIEKVLYAKNGKDDMLVYFLGIDPIKAEYGKRYILHGRLTSKINGNFIVTPFPFEEDGDTDPWLELTEENESALEEGIFARYADFYKMSNNIVHIFANSDISSLEEFQQGTVYLKYGRFPEAGEHGVCVLSGATAERMGANIGDSVEYSIHTSMESDRNFVEETGEMRSAKVVGITNVDADYDGYMWLSDDTGTLTDTFYGYGLGRAVLENEKARKAADEIRALLPDSIKVTLYDQGYSAAAQPIQAIGSTAVTIMAISISGALAVLFLFSYLFVGRQKETVQVLVSLGTPDGKICVWLLSGVFFITAIASLLGAGIGQFVLKYVIKIALGAARSLYASDTRYSESVMGIIREVPEVQSVPPIYSIITGLAVFIAAIILCVFFIRHARHANTPKRGKSSTGIPKGSTSISGRGAMRFAVMSARRGGKRTYVVPAVSLVLTVFLAIIASSTQMWESRLDEYYNSSVIKGNTTSTDGRSVTNLFVPVSAVRNMWKSGNLSDISVSLGWKYSVYKDSDNPAISWDMTSIRSGNFIALNDLSAAPEFYYAGKPDIEWLEGWDESFLSDREYYSVMDSSGDTVYIYSRVEVVLGNKPELTYPVLVSSNSMMSMKKSLGDELSAAVEVSDYCTRNVRLKIVGSFDSDTLSSNIYVPLSFWVDPSWITGEREVVEEGERVMNVFNTDEEREKFFYSNTTLQTCRFTLNSPYDLQEFRDYLTEAEFSQVGKLTRYRTTVMLGDQTFTETVGGLGRYISFSRALFPVLSAAVALLGFVVSWLMISGRRMELAIMRGLGASGIRMFASFFFEQAILCLAGSVTAAIVLTFILGTPLGIWIAAAVFYACYLAGCALSLFVIGRTKLMLLLSERE